MLAAGRSNAAWILQSMFTAGNQTLSYTHTHTPHMRAQMMAEVLAQTPNCHQPKHSTDRRNTQFSRQQVNYMGNKVYISSVSNTNTAIIPSSSITVQAQV